MVDSQQDELLTTYEAAAYVKRSEKWLSRHSYANEEERKKLVERRVKQIFPRYKVGNENRYLKSEIQSSVFGS